MSGTCGLMTEDFWSGLVRYLIAVGLIMAMCVELQARELYLIFDGPRQLGSPSALMQPILYRLDTSDSRLDSVWAAPESADGELVRVYGRAGVVTVVRGAFSYSSLYLFSMSHPASCYMIDLATNGASTDYRLYRTRTGALQVQVQHDGASSSSEQITNVSVDVTTGVALSVSAADTGGRELLLSGTVCSYCGGIPDLLAYGRLTRSTLKPLPQLGGATEISVPDSIVVLKESFGWNLIADEPNFRALTSIPEKNGLAQSEILLYNKDTRTWGSLLIPGVETAVGVINDRLIGVIADQNPRTDYTRRIGGPPSLREESIVIDPIRSRAFTVHLGKESEILWVEDSTAFYRVQDTLFRAMIGADDFQNRTVVLVDFRLHFVHWAFRGLDTAATEERR